MTITGLCLDIEKKPIALFPYPEIGNLKKYLVSLKDASNFKTKHNDLDNVSLSSNATSREQVIILAYNYSTLFSMLSIAVSVSSLS